MSKIVTILFLSTFLLVSKGTSGQQQICKTPTCICSDNHVRVNCTAAGLPSMPHTLHPMIEQLILRNNSIKQLGIYGELSIAPNLRILDLSYNKFERFSAAPFSHQTLLKSLNLDGNGLSGIGKDFFKGLKSLEELQLSKNSLGPDLSENYFQDLKQLKALNLSHNNIASISRITFSSLELLSVLSLRDNDLGIEVNYNSLTELLISNKANLKSNKFITELRIDGLRPWILPNLEYLDLGQNLFTIIRKERSPFSLSHRVTASSSSTPSVDQIFSGSFSNGQIFTIPNDESNGDRVISTEANNNNYWSSLRELKLDHCGIEFIQDNSFNALSSLTVLRLQDNRLSSIRLSTFGENVNLKVLDLSRNQLVTISPSSSQLSPSSSQLSPSSSQLSPSSSVVESDDFSSSSSDASSPRSMKSLLVIDLSGNNLSTIHESLVPAPIQSTSSSPSAPAPSSSSLFSPDTILNLKDNPLMCDCSLDTLRKYLIGRVILKAERSVDRSIITNNESTLKSSNEILSEDISSSPSSSFSSPSSSFSSPSSSFLSPSSAFNIQMAPDLNDMFSDESLLASLESFDFNEEDVKCYQKMKNSSLSVSLVSIVNLDPVRDLSCDQTMIDSNKSPLDGQQSSSLSKWVSKDSLIVIMTSSFILIVVIIVIVIIFLNTNSTSSPMGYFSKSSNGRPLPPLPVASGSSFNSGSSGTCLTSAAIPPTIFKENLSGGKKSFLGIKFRYPFSNRKRNQMIRGKNLFDYNSSRRKTNGQWSASTITDEQCPNLMKKALTTPNTSTLKGNFQSDRNFGNFQTDRNFGHFPYPVSRTTDRKGKKNNLSSNGPSSLSSHHLAVTPSLLTSNHGYNHVTSNFNGQTSPLISDPLINSQHLMNGNLIGNNCLINHQGINHLIHHDEDNYYHRPVYEYLDGPLVGTQSSDGPFTIDVTNIPPPINNYFRPSTADGFNY